MEMLQVLSTNSNLANAKEQLKAISPISVYRHFNNGNSPLFYKYYKEYFGTLHTVVYSPKDLSLIIGVGENSEPMTLSLRRYLDGTLNLPQVLKGRINQTV